MAASGSLGDSDTEAESPPARRSSRSRRATSTPPVDVARFRAAIEDSFGASAYETSSYGHVTGMKMAPGGSNRNDVDPGVTPDPR